MSVYESVCASDVWSVRLWGSFPDCSSKSQCLTRALKLSIAPPSSFLSSHVSFIRGFGFFFFFFFLLQSKEGEKRDDDGEKKGAGRNRKRNVRKVKRYYKEKGGRRRRKVRRREIGGEWQMGPKKRGLLGSALRQSWAYDSFTVGSVCVCVCGCVCSEVCILALLCECVCLSVHWDISVCVFVRVLMFVPWHGASVYLGHFLCVERSQRDCFSTCYPSILLSSHQLLSSISILTLPVINQGGCVCVCVGVACLL